MKTFPLLLSLAFGLTVACIHTEPIDPVAESQKFNAFLDQTFDESLAFSPQSLSRFGKKDGSDKLDDLSEAFDHKVHAFHVRTLKELRRFSRKNLDESAALSYDLFQADLQRRIEDFQWKDYRYAFTQQSGPHTDLPTFMINIHKVESEKDLQDYLARLREFPRVLSQAQDQLRRSEGLGVVPPRFVFAPAMKASQNVISGAPFEAKAKSASPLWVDLKNKVQRLKISDAQKKKHLAEAEDILKSLVQPAYQKWIMALKDLEARSTTEDGAWKFPRGEAYYKSRLNRYTTTNLSADEIHQMGLKNVARLRAEMDVIKGRMGFQGSLQDFFKFIREDARQYYPDTEAGRNAYLAQSQKHLTEIQKKIPQFFRLVPRTPMVIKPVEKFRQDAAGKAFYEEPSDDGGRPGTYYVNLRNMKDAPKFEAEALFYHEGIPGHHFQIALGIELKTLPKMRRYSHYTAFVEGWALYTERLAKEMGGYQNDAAELGRLSMEMIRACRLVVDTGIHAKKWTREQAIQYMNDNLPVHPGMQIEQVERYIVWPGQATAYMVGMLKIVELRERAQKQLGDQFDLRDFHDVVLGHGAVSLDVLEALVEKMILKKQNKGSQK